MRRMRLVLGVAAMLLATSAPAQVNPDPVSEVTRYVVHYYKFAPGGEEKARQLIWDYYLPAMREAKAPEPIILHPDTGDWDTVALWPLAGGYTDLHYNISPTDARWRTIAERKGGDKFRTLEADVSKLIVKQTNFLAHRHD